MTTSRKIHIKMQLYLAVGRNSTHIRAILCPFASLIRLKQITKGKL